MHSRALCQGHVVGRALGGGLKSAALNVVSGNGQKAQSIPPSNRADVLNYLCTIDELVARLPGNL